MAAFGNGNFESAKQEFVDRLNAKVSTSIPFMKKHVNLGRNAVIKGNRSNAIIQLYVPASGNASVSTVSGPNASTSALDLTGRSRTSSFYKIECYAQNASDVLQYSGFEEIFNLEDVKKDLIIPRGQRLANEIERDLVTRNWHRSGGAIISSSASFAALAMTMGILQSIKATGDFTGFIPPMLQSLLANSSTNGSIYFLPNPIVDEMYRKASIGVFHNCSWVNEPFMPEITFGSAWSGVTVATDITDSGTSTIYLDGLPSGDTIYAGTPFYIDGVYDVTVSGVKLKSLKKWFIVQEDLTATGSKDAVSVLPIYFNGDDGYMNNLWVDADSDGAYKIASGTAVTCGLTEGHTYYTGVVRDADAFNWTPFEWPNVHALDNATSSTGELTIQTVMGGDILDRSNVMRLDVAYFGDIVDPRAVRTIYVDATES